MKDFVGREVDLSVSDPWDWLTSYGPGPFRCSIVSGSEQWRLAVARLNVPLSIDGEPFSYVLLEQRWKDCPLNQAIADLVACNAFFFRSIAELNACSESAVPDHVVIGALKPPGWSAGRHGMLTWLKGKLKLRAAH